VGRHNMNSRRFPLTFILLCLFSVPNQEVQAAVIRVEEGCSLHDAITAANTDEASGGCPAGAGADTIVLSGDVTLSAELPVIESMISIDGDGFTISGDNKFRIFDVACAKLTISHLTVSEGSLGEQRHARGGAIRLRDGAHVIIRKSTLKNSKAGAGGAIYTATWSVQLDIQGSEFLENESEFGGGAIQVNGGTVNISSSSFGGNYSRGEGGAIDAMRGRLRVRNSTFSTNRAYQGGAIHSLWNLELDNSMLTQNRADEGGALWAAGGTLTHVTIANNEATQAGGISMLSGVTLRNSIVAGNRGGDCAILNQPVAVANSLIADGSCDAELSCDPMLGDLSADGGYHPLLPDSPAIDAADPAHCTATDQLGTPRPQGEACDIGAIEFTGE